MSDHFSQMPGALIMAEGVTVTALRTWHHVYVQTLGRPGWDLSYQQIADGIGASRRAVIDAVAWLIDHGWLIKHQQADERGDSGPNLYAICREPRTPWSAPGGEPARTTGGEPARTHRNTHHRNTPGPTGAEQASPVHPPTGLPPQRPTRRGPDERSHGTLMGMWAKGYKAAHRRDPAPSYRSRAAAGVKRAVHDIPLADLTDAEWLRLADTAYILGTANQFHLLDAYLGGDGEPRLPVNNRYRLGSGGGAIACATLNTDQPAADWERP